MVALLLVDGMVLKFNTYGALQKRWHSGWYRADSMICLQKHSTNKVMLWHGGTVVACALAWSFGVCSRCECAICDDGPHSNVRLSYHTRLLSTQPVNGGVQWTLVFVLLGLDSANFTGCCSSSGTCTMCSGVHARIAAPRQRCRVMLFIYRVSRHLPSALVALTDAKICITTSGTDMHVDTHEYIE